MSTKNKYNNIYIRYIRYKQWYPGFTNKFYVRKLKKYYFQ